MKKLHCIIAVLSLFLAGCEGFDMGQTGKLEDLFSAEELAQLEGCSADGGCVYLNFTPSFDWEASANKAWITVEPESGSAGQAARLSVVVEANTLTEERQGSIFLELSDKTTFKIPVRQLAYQPNEDPEQPAVLVDGGTYDINANGGNLEVKVSTNTDYEVYIPASARSWLSVADTRAMREEILTFTATKNDSGAARSANVKLLYGTSDEVAFTINQDVAQPDKVDEASIAVSPRVSELAAQGGTVTLTVTSNAEWVASCETAGVTISPMSGNGDATVQVEVPATTDARDIEVKFTASLNDTTAKASAVISQAGEVKKASIAVSPRVSELAAQGGTVSLTVTSNAEWVASCETAGVTISPMSGNGDATVQVEVPATTDARDIEVKFTASLNDTEATASAVISQAAGGSAESPLTPGEHQAYLESVGQRMLKYFNPEDSRALALSLTDLGKAGGFDFELEGTASAKTMNNKVVENKIMRRIFASVLGVTRFSVKSATRLSSTLILPDNDGTYSLDDYKGKQYRFSYKTGKWTESDLGNVNKFVAKWDTSVATVTWEEGSASWEGYVDYNYKAKVEGIPSKLHFEITVDGVTEFTTDITVSVPSNYAIDTNTALWLKGGYTFSVCAKADRLGAEGSVVVAKNGEKLATGGGKVAINDMTDSNNWWKEYTDEWYDGYQWHYDTYTDFNYEYPVDHVKTGEAHASVLDVALQVSGNLRAIIDESKTISDIYSRDGSTLFCNYINNNAAAVLYYTGSQEKIADVKAQPIPHEYWGWDEATHSEKLMTDYNPSPVLIFKDGSKFAVDEFFTEVAFGDLIDAAESLFDQYVDLVE